VVPRPPRITRTTCTWAWRLLHLRDANEKRVAVSRPLRRRTVFSFTPYEIPVVIQDRDSVPTAVFYYPADAKGMQVRPTPEFFGGVILVNGQAWPKQDVERENTGCACSTDRTPVFTICVSRPSPRTLALPRAQLASADTGDPQRLGCLTSPRCLPRTDVQAWLPCGVLPIVRVSVTDVIVDFPRCLLAAGWLATTVPAPLIPMADDPAKKKLTNRNHGLRRVCRAMPPTRKHRRPRTRSDTTGTLARCHLIQTHLRSDASSVQGIDLFGRLQTMLGTVEHRPRHRPAGTLTFKDPYGTSQQGSTEIWEFYNTTVDAHPCTCTW